jgi:hypothetical protein
MTRFPHLHGNIYPMTPDGPGRGDAIDHTVRHFLRSDAGFDVAPSKSQAKGCWSAAEARDRVARAHPRGHAALDGIPHGTRNLLTSSGWWDSATADAVMTAHNRGYRPRYITLSRRTPLPGSPGSKWRQAIRGPHAGNWSLKWDVYRVHARWDSQDHRLRIVSAYRSFVETGPRSQLCSGYVHAGESETGTVDRALQTELRRLRR